MATIEQSLQNILNIRLPSDAPVQLHKWNSNLSACKDYADQHGVPLIVMWSNVGCSHCVILEKAIYSQAFQQYMNSVDYIFCFLYALDEYSKPCGQTYGYLSNNQYYKQKKNECLSGTTINIELGGIQAYVLFCMHPDNPLKDYYPYVKFYWSENGQIKFNKSVRGDDVDGQQGIHAGTYDKAGQKCIDYINNSTNFSTYTPKPLPSINTELVDIVQPAPENADTTFISVPRNRNEGNVDAFTKYIRASSSSAVQTGIWSHDLKTCKQLADANGIPMIAVWCHDTMAVENNICLIQPFLYSKKLQWWSRTCGYILCFVSLSDQYGDQPAGSDPHPDLDPNYIHDEDGNSRYYWFIYNRDHAPYAFTHIMIRFYWHKNGQTVIDKTDHLTLNMLKEINDVDLWDFKVVNNTGTYVFNEERLALAEDNLIDYLQNQSGFNAYNSSDDGSTFIDNGTSGNTIIEDTDNTKSSMAFDVSIEDPKYKVATLAEKMKLKPAIDKNGRICLVDTLSMKAYYSINSKDLARA